MSYSIQTKTEVPDELIDLIVNRVVNRLMPAIEKIGRSTDGHLNVKQAAAYLKVDTSWIYKQVHHNRDDVYNVENVDLNITV